METLLIIQEGQLYVGKEKVPASISLSEIEQGLHDDFTSFVHNEEPFTVPTERGNIEVDRLALVERLSEEGVCV